MSDIEQKDLSPLIEIATHEKARADDRLTAKEVDEIAAELGIEPEYIDDAQVILEQRRQQDEANEKARSERRMKLLWVGIAMAALLGLGATISFNGLSTAAAVVERQKAQWDNVLERQRAVQMRVAAQPESRDKAAELAGSENRVRIERKRYDEAATAYNRRASGFPTGIWRNLFGFPDAYPLSNALSTPSTGGTP